MEHPTVVVTGGSRGIGAATVRALVDRGARVVTCAREADELAALADAIEGPGTVTTQRADVRDEYDVERLMETAARAGNGIDAVVANAGVAHGEPGDTPIDEGSYAAFDDHLRTNARGVFSALREAVPHLTDGARMLVVSCAVARRSRPGYGSYAVSKAAAEAVARQFATDCVVPVGVVDPGPVRTDLGGVDEGDGESDSDGPDPNQAAELVRWALGEAEPETVNGAVLDHSAMHND
jgi:3-oxoacyl-[acyl-carrier protein] reductase